MAGRGKRGGGRVIYYFVDERFRTGSKAAARAARPFNCYAWRPGTRKRCWTPCSTHPEPKPHGSMEMWAKGMACHAPRLAA